MHVFILGAVLGFHVGYQAEPGLYSLGIFIMGSVVVVVLASELCCELRVTLDERTGPVYANLVLFALHMQGIDHINYSCELRENPWAASLCFNNHVLLKLSSILRFRPMICL